MIYIFYNYVSSNLLNVPLLFSYLLYKQLPYKYLALIIFIYIYYMSSFVTYEKTEISGINGNETFTATTTESASGSTIQLSLDS